MNETSQPTGWESVPWRFLDIVFVVLLGIGLAILLLIPAVIVIEATDADPGWAVPVAILTSLINLGFLAAVYLLLVRRRNLSLSALGFFPVRPGALALMIPGYVAVAIVMGIVITFTQPLLGEPPTTSQQLALSSDTSLSLGETIALLIGGAVVAPFVEELVFRGLIYRYLRSKWNVAAAVVVSAVLFALVHGFLRLLPALFVLGAALALVAERYRSLYPSVALHAIWNTVALVVLAVGPPAA